MSTASASARAIQYSRAQVLAFCCILAFLAAASLLATVVHAAPSAPATGGTLTVNSSADNVISDTVLTLREALLIARGGTGVTGLNRPLSAGERLQTLGCTFSATNTITGGCGISQVDTIVFNLGLFDHIITLNTPLPGVDDSQPTTIDGSGPASIYIDVSGHGANQDGLRLYSDGNTVKNLSVGGASRADIYVAANNNLLQNIATVTAGQHGIYLGGDSNIVLSSTVASNGSNGIDISGASNMLMGNTVISNTGAGVSLHGSAQNNSIGCGNSCLTAVNGNHISSNFGYGIELTGTFVTLNFVEANLIGTSGPNLSDGVLLLGAHHNTIGDAGARGNVIGGNHGYGVHLDFFAHDNTIEGNDIGNANLTNFGGGVLVEGGAHHNRLGAAGAGLGNRIMHNAFVGVVLSGVNTHHNAIDNNIITGTISANIWIEKSAHDNVIGSDTNSRNVIGQSVGDGVHIETNAYSNTIGYNYIGTDATLASLSNSGYGVQILGAHGNWIGTNANDAIHNYILHNGAGVMISGVDSYGNHVALNASNANSGTGLILTNSAHGNTIGQPTGTELIQFNQLNGVLVQAGAHDNTFTRLDVSSNGLNGMLLTDSGSDSNAIDASTIAWNHFDGINVRSGAQYNHWSTMSFYGNGGLGIDLNAPSDTTNVPDGPFPVITSVSASGSTTTVSGTATPGSADPTVTVEIYLLIGSSVDASGYGEGYSYAGSAPVDGSGHWTLNYVSGSVGCYTAFQTVHSLGNFTNTSSEFGPNSCRIFLPLVAR